MFPHTKPPAGTQINPLHPLSHGLVGCWLFNEGAGSLANDISGNKNHGRLTKMAPNVQGSGWGGSKFGGSLDFDGTDDYVDAGNDASLNITDEITVSAWVKTTQTYYVIDPENQNGYISKMLDITPYSGFELGIANTNKAGFHLGGTFVSNNLYGTKNISDNIFHHIVGTYDGTTARIYVDGVLDASGTRTNNLNGASAKKLVIGKNYSPLYFNGSIDEVRIYNRALSAEEVKQSYQDPYCMMMKRPINRYYTAVAAGFQNGAAMMAMM